MQGFHEILIFQYQCKSSNSTNCPDNTTSRMPVEKPETPVGIRNSILITSQGFMKYLFFSINVNQQIVRIILRLKT